RPSRRKRSDQGPAVVVVTSCRATTSGTQAARASTCRSRPCRTRRLTFQDTRRIGGTPCQETGDSIQETVGGGRGGVEWQWTASTAKCSDKNPKLDGAGTRRERATNARLLRLALVAACDRVLQQRSGELWPASAGREIAAAPITQQTGL